MKTLYSLVAVFFFAMTGCSTTHPTSEATSNSETMLITYRPKPGKEAELQATLAQAWQVYQADHLVFDKPHVIVRDTEKDGGTRFVEIFTWIQSPENPPADVKAIWKQERSLCDEHNGLEGGPAQLVVGR
jgi:hypothetical protein